MNTSSSTQFLWLGLAIAAGLTALGYLLGAAAVEVREYERTVTAKGLSERELPADLVIWPVAFTLASNDIGDLYSRLRRQSDLIVEHLERPGIASEEISLSAPTITDKAAQAWTDSQSAEFRFVATRTVTVHSRRVSQVQSAMPTLLELGSDGIVFSGDPYQNRVEYLFEGLNEVKPSMVEEATRNARQVARKFAEDSDSLLGKIRRASQGQFTVTDRDSNNPQIKRVRVVSTVEYYLSD